MDIHQNNLVITILIGIFIISCSPNDNQHCEYIYYEDGSLKEQSCLNFNEEALKIIEFNRKGDTINIFRFKVDSLGEVSPIMDKVYKNNKIFRVNYYEGDTSHIYRVIYGDKKHDHQKKYQYIVNNEEYYRKYVTNKDSILEEVYLPRMEIKELSKLDSLITIRVMLPINDTLIKKDTYFKYGLTTVDTIFRNFQFMKELGTKMVYKDSIKVNSYLDRTIEFKSLFDDNLSLIGFLYIEGDSSYHTPIIKSINRYN